MKATFLSFFAVATALALHGKDIMIPTIERNGHSFVSLASLAGHQDIAIKQLTGSGQWVACAGERCALLKEVEREGGETLVPVAALANALGATPGFDEKRARVVFGFEGP